MINMPYSRKYETHVGYWFEISDYFAQQIDIHSVSHVLNGGMVKRP